MRILSGGSFANSFWNASFLAAFAGIENQVAVVGHAAPEQAGEADADIDWELSLMRAARVARSLRRAGYDRAIEVQGRSGSRDSNRQTRLGVLDPARGSLGPSAKR